MTSEQISNLLQKQRTFYKSGVTIPVDFRIAQLKKLYATVKKYEIEVNDALKTDLGKSHYEGFMCESGLVLSEISYMIRHTRKFARRKFLPVWEILGGKLNIFARKIILDSSQYDFYQFEIRLRRKDFPKTKNTSKKEKLQIIVSLDRF